MFMSMYFVLQDSCGAHAGHACSPGRLGLCHGLQYTLPIPGKGLNDNGVCAPHHLAMGKRGQQCSHQYYSGQQSHPLGLNTLIPVLRSAGAGGGQRRLQRDHHRGIFVIRDKASAAATGNRPLHWRRRYPKSVTRSRNLLVQSKANPALQIRYFWSRRAMDCARTAGHTVLAYRRQFPHEVVRMRVAYVVEYATVLGPVAPSQATGSAVGIMMVDSGSAFPRSIWTLGNLQHICLPGVRHLKQREKVKTQPPVSLKVGPF